MNLNWTRIWFSGWWFVFIWLIINSINKWGDNILWVWLWFIVNTTGIWILIYRPKIDGARRNYQYSSLQLMLLGGHMVLLIATYFVAVAGVYPVFSGDPNPAFTFLRNSLAWLLPVQVVFIALTLSERSRKKTVPMAVAPRSNPEMPIAPELQAKKIAWRNQISNAETDEAFDSIEQYLNSHGDQAPNGTWTDFSLLKNRWSELKRKKTQNIISDADAALDAARINHDLLEFIESLSF